MLDTALFQPPQQAIHSGGALHIDGRCGPCMHGGEGAGEPVAVGEIEPVASCLEKGRTRFSTTSERHIIALHITPSHRQRHEPEQKAWNEKVYPGTSRCLTPTSSPLL
jgi:hypothetical protein